MAAFTEQLEVTGLQLTGDPTAPKVQVTLKQPNGNQFAIIDDAANVAEYPLGTQIPHTVGA